MSTPVTAEEGRQPAFQMWMVANVAVGAGWAAFVALLVPPTSPRPPEAPRRPVS